MPTTKSSRDIPAYAFKVPSKTFIFGEYAALDHGEAVLLTTEPNFQVTFEPARPGVRIDPAVRQLLSSYQLDDWMPVCQDPYHGQGGFGSSSALFLSSYHLCQLQQSNPKLDWQSVRHAFKQCHPVSTGNHAPSGYDILAQHQGGLVSIANRQVSQQAWLFSEICMGLIHTQRRSITADHLKQLDAQQLTQIKVSASHCLKHFYQQDPVLFIQSIKHFWQTMIAADRADAHSIQWCQSLEAIPSVLAAKGCGALGYDVLMVLYEPTAQLKLDRKCQNWGLTWYPDVQPSRGYTVQMTS